MAGSMIEPLEGRTLMSVTLTPAQKSAVNKLYTDLHAVESRSGISESQVLTLVADVKTALRTAHKPSTSSTNKLITDTKHAYADKNISLSEGLKLLGDAKSVMSSAGVSGHMQNRIIADATSIVISSHFNAADSKTLFNDLVAVANTFKH